MKPGASVTYYSVIVEEDDAFTIEFPDCLGCETFSRPFDDVVATAREALEGWLEATLEVRGVPARPAGQPTTPPGARLIAVTVADDLGEELEACWAAQATG